MLILLIALTILSGIMLALGFIWILVSSGRTNHVTGEELGAEMMAEKMDEEWEEAVLQKSTFKGEAVSVKREAVIGFDEVKAQIRDRKWGEALPLLLAVGGFLGLLLFGSLTVLMTMENKLVGGFLALTACYTVVRVVIRMVRA